MSVGKRALSALGKLGIIVAVAFAFLFGLAGTIYLSLRTSEVKVPDIVGKDFLAAETALSDAGLNVRKRATRPTADKPNVVLAQLPNAGEVVKVGQTVAVDVSRAPKEGEAVLSGVPETKPEEGQKNENKNTNDASTAQKNQNGNQSNSNNSNNQNKRPKNTNKNANNSNNANNGNANRNANNRNASNSNNTNNRNANAAPRNTNANGGNRNATNSNANRRAPVPSTTPANPGGNTRTPR